MTTKEGSSKIVNLMTPGAGVLMLGRGHISHYSEDVLYSTLSIHVYSTLIAIALRDYDAAFPFHHWMMGLLIYKYEPLWQEVSVKSLIFKWPLRPVGLLFYSRIETHRNLMGVFLFNIWKYNQSFVLKCMCADKLNFLKSNS